MSDAIPPLPPGAVLDQDDSSATPAPNTPPLPQGAVLDSPDESTPVPSATPPLPEGAVLDQGSTSIPASTDTRTWSEWRKEAIPDIIARTERSAGNAVGGIINELGRQVNLHDQVDPDASNSLTDLSKVVDLGSDMTPGINPNLEYHPDPSRVGLARARGLDAASGLLQSSSGLLGYAGGAALGAPAAPETLGTSSVAGGIVGATAAESAYKSGLERLAGYGFKPAQEIMDAQANPNLGITLPGVGKVTPGAIASLAAVAPMAANTLKNLTSEWIATVAARGSTAAARNYATAKTALIGTTAVATGAAADAAQQEISTGQINPQEVGESGLFGLALANPEGRGFFTGETPINPRVVPDRAEDYYKASENAKNVTPITPAEQMAIDDKAGALPSDEDFNPKEPDEPQPQTENPPSVDGEQGSPSVGSDAKADTSAPAGEADSAAAQEVPKVEHDGVTFAPEVQDLDEDGKKVVGYLADGLRANGISGQHIDVVNDAALPVVFTRPRSEPGTIFVNAQSIGTLNQLSPEDRQNIFDRVSHEEYAHHLVTQGIQENELAGGEAYEPTMLKAYSEMTPEARVHTAREYGNQLTGNDEPSDDRQKISIAEEYARKLIQLREENPHTELIAYPERFQGIDRQTAELASNHPDAIKAAPTIHAMVTHAEAIDKSQRKPQLLFRDRYGKSQSQLRQDTRGTSVGDGQLQGTEKRALGPNSEGSGNENAGTTLTPSQEAQAGNSELLRRSPDSALSSRPASSPLSPYERRFGPASRIPVAAPLGDIKDGFYSQLSRVIDAKMPGKASADQVRSMLKGNGVKDDELKWSGLDDYLTAHPQATKAEVQNFLKTEGGIKIQTHVLGKAPSARLQELVDLGDERDLTPQEDIEYSRLKRQEEDSGEATKYDQYQILGGENYREQVFSLPTETSAGDWNLSNEDDGWYATNSKTGERRGPFENAGAAKSGLAEAKGSDYRSSHFSDIPNYLAHMRLNDRVDSEGKPGTLIEEMQSDRHQAGREHGYVEDMTPAERKEGFGVFSGSKSPDTLEAWYHTKEEAEAYLKSEGKSGWHVEASTDGERHPAPRSSSDRVPDAPFRKTWHEFLFRNALNEAVQNGKDWIGWTPGVEQVNRYEEAFRKVADKVEWEKPDADGDKRIHVTKDGKTVLMGNVRDGVIKNSSIPQANGKTVEEALGKMIAAKINGEESGHLTGNDITVGGEGMKGFYDKIVPQYVEKYAKKWGVKPELSTIETQPSTERPPIPGGDGSTKTIPAKTEQIWKLPINDAMRESIKTQGQPVASPLGDISNASKPKGESKPGELADIQSTVDKALKDQGIKGIDVVMSTDRNAPAWADPKQEGKVFINPDVMKEGLSRLNPRQQQQWIGRAIAEEVYHNAQFQVESDWKKDGTLPAKMDAIYNEISPVSRQKTLSSYGDDSIDPSKAISGADKTNRTKLFVREHTRRLLQSILDGKTTEDSWEKSPNFADYLQSLFDKIKAYFTAKMETHLGSYLRAIHDAASKFRGEPEQPVASPLGDLVRNTNKVARTKLGDFFQKYLTPEGMLPRDVFDAWHDAEGRKSAVTAKANLLLRDMHDGMKQLYKGRLPKGAELAREMGLINDALQGNGDFNGGPLEAPIRAMRNFIDNLSDELMRSGAVDSKLIPHIEANKGFYLTRSYQAFDDANWFKKWEKKVGPDMANRAKSMVASWVAQDYMRPQMKGAIDAFRKAKIERFGQMSSAELAQQSGPPQTLTPDDYNAIHDALMEKGEAWTATPEGQERVKAAINQLVRRSPNGQLELFAGGKLGSKNLSILKRRTSISPEIRAMMGEYTDPKINFARSAGKMGALWQNHLFLNRVKELGMNKFLFEKPTGDHFVPIAAEGSATMAPLNGLHTTPEIATAFSQFNATQNLPFFLKALQRVNLFAKMGKTVLSPASIGHNAISQTSSWLLNGHAFAFNPANWREPISTLAEREGWTGIRNLMGASKDEARAYLDHMMALGVIEPDARVGELKATMRDALSKGETMEGLSMLGSRTARILGATSKTHEFPNSFTKMLLFEAERARYAKALPDMPPAQLDALASHAVRDITPTYSQVPKAVRAIRGVPLAGPFISFASEAWRNYLNTYKMAYRDYQNPKTRNIGIQRLIGAMLYSSLFALAAKATASLLGIDSKEERKFRKFLPDWSKNSQIFWLANDGKGNLKYLDTSYITHSSLMDAPIQAILNGKDPTSALIGSFEALFKPALDPQIGTMAMGEAAMNAKHNGSGGLEPVSTAPANTLKNAAERAEYVGKQIQPGIIDSAERMYEASQGDVKKYGQQRTIQDELLRNAGLNVTSLNLAQSLRYAGLQYADQMQQAESRYRMVLTREGSVSPQELASAKNEMESTRQALFSDMADKVSAAQNLGLPSDKLIAALQDSKLGRPEIKTLLSGTYAPFNPSLTTLKAASSNAEEQGKGQGSNRLNAAFAH